MTANSVVRARIDQRIKDEHKSNPDAAASIIVEKVDPGLFEGRRQGSTIWPALPAGVCGGELRGHRCSRQ